LVQVFVHAFKVSEKSIVARVFLFIFYLFFFAVSILYARPLFQLIIKRAKF
jgi:hypothetical protein